MPTPRFEKTRTIVYLILDMLLRPSIHALGIPYLLWIWWNHVPIWSWGFLISTAIYVAVAAALTVLREVALDDRIWTKFY